MRKTSGNKWHKSRQNRHKYLFLAILLAIPAIYYSKDLLYFDNGSGGANWQIGQAKANLSNAHLYRSLAELQKFALELVNRDRQLNGLPSLVEDSLLSRAAQAHAEDMLEQGYYSHTSPEGKTPTQRFRQLGGQGGVGENIMYQSNTFGAQLNYSTLEKFQRSWMSSDGHRQNLLNRHYTRFGYGIVADALSGKMFAVQDFAASE